MRNSNQWRRLVFLLLTMSLLFSLLVTRLTFIQIINAEELTRWAVRQRSQSIILGHGRGDIQDRNGISLINGIREEAIVAFPSIYHGKEDLLARGSTSKYFMDKIMSPPHSRFPFIVERGERGTLAFKPDTSIPGVVKVGVQGRYSPQVLAAHVVGHIRNSDGKGQKGIELFYDAELTSAQPPILSAFVDGRENLIEGLGIRMRGGSSGQHQPYNVVLTIDHDLQEYVERIMDAHIRQGAVVVMNPSNGDILALASRPNYQPGRVEDYLGRKDGPFNNRATISYQPGSIFKIVLSAAAFEEGLTSLFKEYSCHGSVELSEGNIPCPHVHPHAELTFTDAFAYSCNSTFIHLGQELGAEMIERYARILGLGEVAGLPLGEDAGYIPSAGKIETQIALANTSIGQGLVQITPIQAAQLIAIIANDGKKVKPRLVDSITDCHHRTVKRFPHDRGTRVLSYSTVNKLKYVLNSVTTYGTGKGAANPKYMVGGKTGTAQSGRRREGREVLNHWFVGMAPLENSRVVVVVFMEERGDLGAAEIFRSIAGRAVRAIR
ncbi:MAG: penicillin-binding protein 2 [Firmicutes bacterium]|nr:penicillin-binding protein 2 [Bacillota bacterium]